MRELALRPLPARELLRVRTECAARQFSDEAERAVYMNAALLARSLYDGEARVYADAEAVLSALPLGEVNAWTARYARCEGEGVTVEESAGVNAAFDAGRYARMKGDGAE